MSEIENSMTDMTWGRHHSLALIGHLRNNPCLWNTLDSKFGNKAKRTEVLNQIQNELIKIKPNVTVQNIKNKLRTIQSQLSREKVLYEKFKKRSGIDELYIPKLWCFNNLSFIVNQERNNTEKLTLNVEFEKDKIDEDLTKEPVEHTHPKKRKLTLSQQLQKKALTTLECYKSYIQQPAKQKLSKEEEFCRYLCSELSKIKIELNFDEVKLKILQLVAKKILEEKTMLRDQSYFKADTTHSQDESVFVNEDPLHSSSSSSSISSPSYNSKSPIFNTEQDNEDMYIQSSIPGNIVYPNSTKEPTATFTLFENKIPQKHTIFKLPPNSLQQTQNEIYRKKQHSTPKLRATPLNTSHSYSTKNNPSPTIQIDQYKYETNIKKSRNSKTIDPKLQTVNMTPSKCIKIFNCEIIKDIPKTQKNKNILNMAIDDMFDDLIEEDPLYELSGENTC